jgi:hypothetical protein
MKAAEERAAAKLLQEQRKQVVDDDTLEREEIINAMKQQKGEGEMEQMDIDPESIKLPAFPPEGVKTIKVFDAKSIAASGMNAQLTDQVEQDILMIWKFVHDFSFVLNVKPVSPGHLAGSIALGVESKHLADLHMSILKLLLADIEESHSLVNQEDGLEHKGGQLSGLDRVVHTFSQHLAEIWEWHYGSDLLRAQTNYLTWPEVMRQFLIIFGLGPERPHPRKNAGGEDAKGGNVPVDKDGNPTGPKLVVPATCKPGTIKGSTYTILSEVGIEGLTPPEICQLINDRGLRGSVSTTKSPEASVSALLSKDSFVFEKQKNGKFALRAICSWHRKQLKKKAEGEAKEEDKAKNQSDVKKEEETASPVKMEEAKEEEDNNSNEADNKPRRLGEGFVLKLGVSEYNKLTMAERTGCLAALCNTVLECPSFYQQIEASQREKDTVTKRLREVSREEKKLATAIGTATATITAAAVAAKRASPNGKGANGELKQPPKVDPALMQEIKIQKAELEQLRVEKKELVRRLAILTDEVNRRPLGLDRRFNRYWLLKLSENKSDSLLIIEDANDHSFRVIKDKESLDLLVSKLNPRGFRESKLIDVLKSKTENILAAMPAKAIQAKCPEASIRFMTDHATEASSITLKENRKPPSHEVDFEAFDKTFLVEKLKADMLDIYHALPGDSFDDEAWDGAGVWLAKVKSATKVYDLRDILGEFEGAIKQKLIDHDHFNRNPNVIPGAWVPRDAVDDDDDEDNNNVVDASQGVGADEDEEGEEGMIGYVANEGDVSWLPPTTSALQYRLRCLDAALSFRRSVKPLCNRIDAYKYIQRDNPLNKDGTNFTTMAATGQIKVMQNFSRERSRSSFPPFPEKTVVFLRGDFMLSYQDFHKQFRKIGMEMDPKEGIVKSLYLEEETNNANANAAAATTTKHMNVNEDLSGSDDDFYVGSTDKPKAKDANFKIEEEEEEESEEIMEEGEDDGEWEDDD